MLSSFTLFIVWVINMSTGERYNCTPGMEE